MELVSTQPASFENLFDGVSARYCNIDGWYYVSVRDLIIGICVKNPKKDEASWVAAYTHASMTWINMCQSSKKKELTEYLKVFQFKGIF